MVMKKFFITLSIVMVCLLAFLLYWNVFELKKRQAEKIVVLDPGHGGVYPGFELNGLVEKDIVLQVSLYTKALLEEKGYKVYLTRQKDEECSEESYIKDLSCRPALAHNVDADLFVSIHANAFPANTNVRGVEAYYFTPFRDKEAAEALGSAITAETGLPLRSSKFGNFKVLRDSRVPSTLVEVGYLTNREDAKLLASAEFQKRLAAGISNGIIHYFTGNS